MIINHDDDFIYLKANSKEAISLGAAFVNSLKAYKMPISISSIESLKDAGFDVSSVSTLYEDLKMQLDKGIKIKEKADTEGLEVLRPYQRVDVEFIKNHQNVAIFNEQRTGKTPTILSAVKDKIGTGIIICPSGLKLNWQMEYDKWVGKGVAKIIKGTPLKRKKDYKDFYEGVYNVIIISYETFRRDVEHLSDLLKEIDVMIIDEAHRLRNHDTQQSRAIHELSKKAKHIYPMTGTPAVNHPSDVYGILRLVYPKRYRSYWQFIERYFGYTEGPFGRELLGFNKGREKEFQEILQKVSIQRKRRDVMSWIPKVTHRDIYLELDTKQNKYYNQIMKEFMYGENIIPNTLAQLTRLRQVCLDPKMLMLESTSPKTEFIKEYLKDNPDEKIIVFSMFTSYLNALKKELPDAVLLTGEQTQEQKQHAVNQIQSGESNVMLANIIAGGTGWTLDNVDTVIFTDKSYNPVDNEQAADRFIPTDPNKEYGAKQILSLKMEKTVDAKIDRMIQDKINVIKYVNDYGVNALVNYGEKENNNNAGVSD
jgi:SWI/SNF-related matrix-associated actin-dependent regulator 1 of chromatin subfamily A